MACLCSLSSTAHEPGRRVDLELVIAADVSTSMDREEKRLQHEGFVQAFLSGAVQRAIIAGELGRIAVTYVEWGGLERTRIVVPWMLIDSVKAAKDFAAQLAESKPGRLAYGTNMGNAIATSASLLDDNGFNGTRRVIDISGDGIANRGQPVPLARAAALARGITINGLPIILRQPSDVQEDTDLFDIWDPEVLIAYFRDEVIGGDNAFLMPVIGREQFGAAIQAKLLREISGVPASTRHAALPDAATPGAVQMSSVLSRSHWVRWRE
ncbi:DUF1194 domain-containing protein [Ancylobacter gelatini]|uniref:DUF1194 domain-containing protein n=1 Tax=Ancylobacter gelatini TaxID=2919920 RepID=UPI00315AB1DA